MARLSPAVRAAIDASRAAAPDRIARWRNGAEYRALARAFADCSEADPEPTAERAMALFADAGWAAALLGPLVDAVAEDPFFEPPFKASRDALRTGAILFDCPAVSITACVTGASAMASLPAPASIVFSGRIAVTRYARAGGATLRRWRATPVTPAFRASEAGDCVEEAPLALADGDVRRIDGRSEAQLLADATSDIVTLVATVRAGAAQLMREHAIADGALLRVASGDDRASRVEMLLAFLRTAGRVDAGPRFEAASRDPAFQLRWSAMREWLGLDARAALPRLAAMAATDPHPEVRDAAARTLTAVRDRLELRCPA